MVVTCDIEFDQNPHGTYFAGQLVSGVVKLKADKSKDVKGVMLKVVGYSATRWREGSRKKSTFYGREDYMATLTYLMGSDENTKSTIHAGTHDYTFACQLPYNCPSSFEGRYGYIRYIVKVIFLRPWKYDQVYTRGFTVSKTLDLNYDSPQLKLPSNTSAYKAFCCGPWKTEPLQIVLSTPQGGYVPGQNIPIKLLIINNTNIAVAETKVSLVMLVRYFSQEPHQHNRVEYVTVSEAKGESVIRNCTRSFQLQLPVPATPPTCLNACKLIQIAYHIEAEANMKGWHGHQIVVMPITIGNLPLWDSVVLQQPTSSRARTLDQEAVSNDNGSAIVEASSKETESKANPFNMTPPTNLYPDLPPPSYQESMHTVRGDINEDELHAFGRCEFAPLYPVYTFPKATAPPVTTPDEGEINPAFEREI